MTLSQLIRGELGKSATAEEPQEPQPQVVRAAEASPEPDGPRLDLPDCLALVRAAFEAVEAEYIDGVLALLDTDPDLARRFHETEAAIDAAVKAGPPERDLRAALAAHVAVIREACQRRRAQLEAAADTMPELPDDAEAAVGFAYATGGAWASVKRGSTGGTVRR